MIQPRHSALFEGPVVHQRVRPRRHRLSYDVFALLLDLDEISSLDSRSPLFGYDRHALVSFWNRDHGDGSGRDLRPWVNAKLAEAGLQPDGGPIRVLCYPRILGYAFNPLTVYFCYRQDGAPAAILYEVRNTFHERHTYVIPVEPSSKAVIRQSCEKVFYVSPFVPMECTYHFRILPPGASVAVRECTIANAGWAFEPMEPGSAPKAVSIRGYAVGDRSAGVSVEIDEPGQYELSGAGELKKL